MNYFRASLVPLDVEAAKEFKLRVSPPELRFKDTLPGRLYYLALTIQNLGPSNQRIRFLPPANRQFKVLVSNMENEVASGLLLTAMVEYHPDKLENSFDYLIFFVEKSAVKIPLIGLIPCCELEIDSEVDFGTLVANYKVYSKEISIANRGKVAGSFAIQYQGKLPIVISPTDGTVQPNSLMMIKVDFCAEEPRVVDENVKVSLEGLPDVFLNIKVCVVEQILELLNMNDDKKVECINFGSTFFGTSKIERIRLYNNSPGPINWVAIMQNDSVGEELGTNIHQRTDVTIHNLRYLRKIKDLDITTFISCVPNEGWLSPYKKTTITFCFNPKLIADSKKDVDSSHRQDYAIFLRFDSIGSKLGFLRDDDSKTITSNRFQKLELALTGSGLPVILEFNPGNVLNFEPCFKGEQSEVMCTIYNQSKSLPVICQFKKTAHLQFQPEWERIDVGHMKDLRCTFIPSEAGIFKIKYFIEIIGPVADEKFKSVSLKTFHKIPFIFNCVCKRSPEKVLKITPSTSPLVNNPTAEFKVKDWAKAKEYAPIAMLQSTGTSNHNHPSSRESTKDDLIAFPNDRASSVKSGEQNKHFRTIFTNIPRYNYVDPEFAYTDSEKLEKKAHKDHYDACIKYIRNVKKKEREGTCSRDDRDLGLCSGLKSPTLSQSEVEEHKPSECEIKPHQLLSTRSIESKEAYALERKVLTGLKSKPSTHREKFECSLTLTPRQIHQVVVGPAVLNFGDICVNSTNTQELHIVNMLCMHVLIQLDVNLKELQKTSQFSYVIPPTSSTYISMIFESPAIGKVWKSFSFTINNIPGGHILVMAVVTPVRLEVSSEKLVLRPYDFLLKTCFRETVRIYNHQNYLVHFEWRTVNTSRGTGFLIHPTKGTVEPFCSLYCEVTWEPGFSSPEEGEFILDVSEGDKVQLKCVAQPGPTKVLHLEPKIIFSKSPQGFTAWRKIILHNVGQNHAFFKVCDQSLLPIIDIVPSEGIVPLGGLTVLSIACTSSNLEEFDTRAKVDILHGSSIDLRIGGTVAIANVEIVPNRFLFSTYIGNTQMIPFLIKNKGVTAARVEFNLQGCEYFSMDFKDGLAEITDPEFPNIYYFEVQENSSVEGGMVFSPKEVASYEYTIQVRINCLRTSEFHTESQMSKYPMTPRTSPFIQSCVIQGVVLKVPLKLSKIKFVFEVPVHTLKLKKKVRKTQGLVLGNFSTRDVPWLLDIRDSENVFKDGTFRLSKQVGIVKPGKEFTVWITFCPRHYKNYIVNIPLYVNDNSVCYQTIQLFGEIKVPTLCFEPSLLFFTPTPLDVTAVMKLTLMPRSYYSDATLMCRTPLIRFLGGITIQPLFVRFPYGATIKGSPDGINAPVTCHICFKSSIPVSFSCDIRFNDGKGNRFIVPLVASADNSILSLYPYMSKYLDKEDIVVRNDKDGSFGKIGVDTSLPSQEARLPSPHPSKCNDDDAAKRFFVGTGLIPEKLNSDESDTAKIKGISWIEKEMENEHYFPQQGTKAYDFYQKALYAAQTWFTLFGWPEGPHFFTLPETIRRDVYKMQEQSSPKGIYRPNNLLRHNKTIYDVVLHFSGKLPNGIYSNQALSEDHTKRVLQLYLQHSSLLDFLNAEGAHISHIFPELLFSPEDYNKWTRIKPSTKILVVCCSISKKTNFPVLSKTEFEDYSKRTWMDLFLQIYKVLVLSRVVPHPRNKLPHLNVQHSPQINPRFISSNIYSNSERTVLSWMNTNYENTRCVMWEKSQKGIGFIPSERWIVNFDSDLADGLVLAAQLGSYCPFLIESHFVNMYTQPTSSEQYFHNSVIIVNALREIDFRMGIQASDICDPNPILLLMLCVYLYERLPGYLPTKELTFECSLHDIITQSLLLKNPFLKALSFEARIIGRDADNFSLVESENTMTIAAKNKITMNVKFTSRFLRPVEALLVLSPKSVDPIRSTTLTFALKGKVHNFKAVAVIECKTPCYQWKEFTVKVQNPFQTAGDFNVILVESSTFMSLTSQLIATGQFVSSRRHGDPGSTNDSDSDENSSSVPDALKTSIKSSFIREFFCTSRTLQLDVKKPSFLKFFFLPFDMQKRYCIIILSHKQIGELIYVAEGQGTVPFPSSILPTDSTTSRDVSFAFENELNVKKQVTYVKCKPFQTTDVDLILPLTNEAKEEAFAFAAQKQISEQEYQRRLLTGTLESSSIRVAIALLGLTRAETFMLFNISKLKRPKSIVYLTELSLPNYFQIPDKIYIPQYPEMQSKGLNPKKKTVPNGCFSVPLHFCPDGPGRYPCEILLISRYDVRLFYIEGVVSEELPAGTLKFETPSFEALTQEISVNNNTKSEWKFHIVTEGEYFSGPSILHVRPGETVQYPLTFKPVLECEITGKVTLQNQIDGVERVYEVKGIGGKPVALEHIVINTYVGTRESRTIMVPNYAKNKLVFKVSSDLPMVWGSPHIVIGPLDVVPYSLQIRPRNCGIFKGKLSFSVKDVTDVDASKYIEQDKDKDQDQDQAIQPIFQKSLSELSQEFYEKDPDSNVQIWYSLELHIHPEDPVHIIEMSCPAMECTSFEIPLCNAKEETLIIKVQFSSPALSGIQEFELQPKENIDYEVCYSPATTGYRDESIIFQPDKAPEFWYLAKFTIELPEPEKVPEIFCELGKHCTQTMYLINPTHETLELQQTNSNPDNFVLDAFISPLTVLPHSTKEVLVQFHPSGLGRNRHQGSIIFHCTQFKEWKFLLSGVGMYPKPLEIERTTTYVGLDETVTKTFQNPTKENVSIDIILTNREKPKNLYLGIQCDSFLVETSTFKLNLKHEQGIVLPPKGIITIPVSYQPKAMKLQKTMVVVQMMRENGQTWPVDNFNELSTKMKRTMGIDTGEIQSIQWIYPIIGLPKGSPINYNQVLLKCQAKKQTAKHMNITLAADFLGENPVVNISSFVVFPKKYSYASYEDLNVLPIKREFQYDILYESEEVKSRLKPCILLYLTNKFYDKKTQRITFEFNVMFSPTKPLRSEIILQIESITDGTWDFPIKLVATEPDVEGVINIRGAGLYKEAFVELSLTSTQSVPVQFTAHFKSGSSPEFFVRPQSGEIRPLDTDGTHIVVGFTPRILSRVYKATLVVETEDMYNMYVLNGLPELIKPPMNVKAKIDATNKMFDNKPVVHRNFVRENIKYITTGLSSTIKTPSTLKKK